MTLHILNNFLPNHVAGIEVYVFNLCKKDISSNYVLITGEENLQYEIEGLKVYVIVEDNQFLTNILKIISSINIDTVHYHLFEQGKLYEEETLNELKKYNLKLVFTFHLVQYYCSTLTLKQNNQNSCSINANLLSCSQCFFQTFYMPKYPIILRHHDFLKKIQFIGKIKNHFNSASNKVNDTLSKFNLIGKLFDELITINPDFYEKLQSHIFIKNKLKLISSPFSTHKLKTFQKMNTVKLVYLGRVENSKGIDKLIDFASKLDNSNVLIHIYGQINDPKYSSEYFEKVSSKSATKIIYKGLLNPNAVRDVLKKYDYLIHPSQIAEMTPLVIREAFQVGLPVIGNDIFGINTYVKDGINGWILDFNDDDICQKFTKLFLN